MNRKQADALVDTVSDVITAQARLGAIMSQLLLLLEDVRQGTKEDEPPQVKH